MKSKILLSFVLMFVFIFTGCNTDEDMQAQYDLGYQEGYAVGFEEGHDEGYEAGYEAASAEFTIYPVGDYYVNTKDDPLTIRDDAAQNAEKLGTIPRGEDITVTETKSHWGYVTHEGISGWINLDYCKEGKNPNPPAEYTSETVYVTNTGECYHKDGCSYLKSKNEISLKEAEAQGYRPCSRCF